MASHPEAAANESFVGNVKADEISHLSSLKTARLGDVAYYLDGKKIPAEQGLRPLLIGNTEAGTYDAIMMARFRAIRGHYA